MDEVRRHNLGTVLERLHLSGPLSRSELTAMTGLNRSTIADLLGQPGDRDPSITDPSKSLLGPRKRTLEEPRQVAKIDRSGLGADAPLIGAAELVLSRAIADPAGGDGRGSAQGRRAE